MVMSDLRYRIEFCERVSERFYAITTTICFKSRESATSFLEEAGWIPADEGKGNPWRPTTQYDGEPDTVACIVSFRFMEDLFDAYGPNADKFND